MGEVKDGSPQTANDVHGPEHPTAVSPEQKLVSNFEQIMNEFKAKISAMSKTMSDQEKEELKKQLAEISMMLPSFKQLPPK